MRISDCSSDVFSSDLDAQFFYPDGPAAMRVADALGLPFSAKARGADISHFGHDPATRSQVIEAGATAAGLLAVSETTRGVPARSEERRVGKEGVSTCRSRGWQVL